MVIGHAVNAEIEQRGRMRTGTVDGAAPDGFGDFGHRQSHRYRSQCLDRGTFDRPRGADLLAFEIGCGRYRETRVNTVGCGGEQADGEEVVISLELARAHQSGEYLRAFDQIGEQSRQFQDLVFLEPTWRVGGDHPGDIGHAIQHHLRLLYRASAQCAVGKQVDLAGAAGFLVDRFGKRLHGGDEGLLLVGREHRELEFLHLRLCCGRQSEHHDKRGYAHRKLHFGCLRASVGGCWLLFEATRFAAVLRKIYSKNYQYAIIFLKLGVQFRRQVTRHDHRFACKLAAAQMEAQGESNPAACADA